MEHSEDNAFCSHMREEKTIPLPASPDPSVIQMHTTWQNYRPGKNMVLIIERPTQTNNQNWTK